MTKLHTPLTWVQDDQTQHTALVRTDGELSSMLDNVCMYMYMEGEGAGQHLSKQYRLDTHIITCMCSIYTPTSMTARSTKFKAHQEH